MDSVFETFDQFFNLSPEVKAKYAKQKITVQNVKPQNGWDSVEAERSVVLGNSLSYVHASIEELWISPPQKSELFIPLQEKKIKEVIHYHLHNL